jgi:UPF0716 family protein affecting phage T7 exclusion
MILIILIPYLFAEIYLSLYVGERIGVLGAVIWTVATMIIGTALLKNAPFALLGNMQALHLGKLDIQRFHDATFSYFVGALLLIIPGVFSDLMGMGALLYAAYLQFVAKITPDSEKFYQRQGDDDVIDAEIIDECDSGYDRIERK